MRVKVKKYKPDFKKSCELLKKFSEDLYNRADKKHMMESIEFYETNGFHHEDCWSLDSWFAINMVPRLIYLKKNCASCPGDFYFKYSQEEAKVRWNKILDSIIAALQIIAGDEYINGISGNEAYQEGKERIIEVGLKNFIKYYSSLWD